jgi:hypothetical protein
MNINLKVALGKERKKLRRSARSTLPNFLAAWRKKNTEFSGMVVACFNLLVTR